MSKVDELFTRRLAVFPLVGAVEGVGAVEAASCRKFQHRALWVVF